MNHLNMQTNSQSKESPTEPDITKSKFAFTIFCTCEVCPYYPNKHILVKAPRGDFYKHLDEASKRALKEAGKAYSANTSQYWYTKADENEKKSKEVNKQFDKAPKRVLNKAVKTFSVSISAKASCEEVVDEQIGVGGKKIAVLKISSKNKNSCPCDEVNKQITDPICCKICCDICSEEAAAKKEAESTDN